MPFTIQVILTLRLAKVLRAWGFFGFKKGSNG